MSSLIQQIQGELRRVGVDPGTLGAHRGTRVSIAASGLYQLEVDGLGVLWVGLGNTILERLLPLPGGRGACEGAAWFWREVFPEMIDGDVKKRVFTLVQALKQDDAEGAVVVLRNLRDEVGILPLVEVGEYGQVVALAAQTWVGRQDAHECSAATWLAVVDFLSRRE